MNFILGCNYWASNAGAEMWQSFDPVSINKDLELLSRHGITHMRVFPNWRDFQPITPIISGGGRISGYEAKNSDEYYLDKVMLDRFSQFTDICNRYNIKLIVGLITGWMSGSLFIPSALYGKNLITDPLAQYFEQLFIKGFVSRFKDNSAIYAWDLGNECNCMSPVNSRWEAASWTAMISNAIRSADSSRPIVSGMHGLGVDGGWTIKDQGEFTDILTTHPYPFWCEHTRIDETLSVRTTLHPTAQGKFYSELSGRPCLAEEIGTMGPMVCSDELAADFLRINMFSLWANGACGVMWWCACDQTSLTTFPYTEQMVEVELGMLDTAHNPKPVLREMKKFADFLKTENVDLPKAAIDGLCILSHDIRHWGIAYTTYILAKRAGLNIGFMHADDELVASPLYLLPSINHIKVMKKEKYEALKRRVYDGADLYISIDNAILSEFKSLAGMKVIDSYDKETAYSAVVADTEISFTKRTNIFLEPTAAKVLVYDNDGNPFISENKYGKGRVFFVNAPIEDLLIDTHDMLSTGLYKIYELLFSDYVKAHPIKISNSELFSTIHYDNDNRAYLVVTNHTREEQSFDISYNGYTVDKVIYGELNKVRPYNACVILLKSIL